MRWLFVTAASALSAALLAALPTAGQEPGSQLSSQSNSLSNSPAQQPIAFVAINGSDGVKVSGALDVSAGRASIGNSGTITAGDRTATIALARGGQLRLCSTTTLHLTTDRSLNQAGSHADPTAPSAALLIALERGALEANYATGKYSDVLLTPDFRVLISGPGTADLKVRVSSKGDTCVDNHGAAAPYVTVSSQFNNGVYRVQPNQRVLFEHGSLHDVVDNESEPCGCPPPQVVTTAQSGIPVTGPVVPATTPAAVPPPGQPAATIPANANGTAEKPGNAGTEFPLAVSEGLAPPPPPPSTPVAAPGEVHVQVTVPLAYDGKTGESSSAASGATGVPAAPSAPAVASAPVVTPAPIAVGASPQVSASAPTGPAAAKAKREPKPGVFHRIGRFFSKLFGS